VQVAQCSTWISRRRWWSLVVCASWRHPASSWSSCACVKHSAPRPRRHQGTPDFQQSPTWRHASRLPFGIAWMTAHRRRRWRVQALNTAWTTTTHWKATPVTVLTSASINDRSFECRSVAAAQLTITYIAHRHAPPLSSPLSPPFPSLIIHLVTVSWLQTIKFSALCT